MFGLLENKNVIVSASVVGVLYTVTAVTMCMDEQEQENYLLTAFCILGSKLSFQDRTEESNLSQLEC